MEQVTVDGLGFAHFLMQADGVGKGVLAALLLLSVASWYLIVTLGLANWLARRRADAFLAHFGQSGRLVAPGPEHQDNACAALLAEALAGLHASPIHWRPPS